MNKLLAVEIVIFSILGCAMIIKSYAPFLTKNNKKSTRLLCLIFIVFVIGLIIYGLSDILSQLL